MPQKNFTEEFKKEAVRMALTSGRTRRQDAQFLDVDPSTLKSWIRQYRDGVMGEPPHLPDPEDRIAELEHLRRANEDMAAQVEELRREKEDSAAELDQLRRETGNMAVELIGLRRENKDKTVELGQLRRSNEILRQERETLKRTVSIFAMWQSHEFRCTDQRNHRSMPDRAADEKNVACVPG
jgi:transposase